MSYFPTGPETGIAVRRPWQLVRRPGDGCDPPMWLGRGKRAQAGNKFGNWLVCRGQPGICQMPPSQAGFVVFPGVNPHLLRCLKAVQDANAETCRSFQGLFEVVPDKRTGPQDRSGSNGPVFNSCATLSRASRRRGYDIVLSARDCEEGPRRADVLFNFATPPRRKRHSANSARRKLSGP